ncbi:MAG: SDR family NAD(P)-dependent oxidoreductase [Candidatus Omnitrophica bacterium]|nr:SDR family NAD(P)-dependent oxidoreductase [Candidatus Omnitrophota bacterium]
MKTYLVTGAAGFIASKTAELLLQAGHRVIGIDNMNDYYDTRIKEWRLKTLKVSPRFSFYKIDIENKAALQKLFRKYRFDAILNLAARAGVRYSMTHPHVYFTTNVLGTVNLLDLAKEHKIKKFVLASTSSLYAGQPMPFKENLSVNTPISPYAASKKGAEAACYSYHYLYGIDVTIVRYFTVYGPAGRPDMSVFIFTKMIDEGKPMDVFGDGSQSRDFTYVDDIARGTIKAIKNVGFKIINLGENDPYTLTHMISLIEKNLDKKAKVVNKAFHKADIKATWADIREAKKILGWTPKVDLATGIKRTVEWYLENKNWLRTIKPVA